MYTHLSLLACARDELWGEAKDALAREDLRCNGVPHDILEVER